MRSHNPTGSGLTKLWHACRLSIHRTLPTRAQVMEKAHRRSETQYLLIGAGATIQCFLEKYQNHHCVDRQGSCRRLRGRIPICVRWNSLCGHIYAGCPMFDGI